MLVLNQYGVFFMQLNEMTGWHFPEFSNNFPRDFDADTILLPKLRKQRIESLTNNELYVCVKNEGYCQK